MALYTKEQIKQANEVNLIEFSRSHGFTLSKSDNKAWKVENFGGLFVFQGGFYHHTEEKKGNPIKFVQEYMGLTFPQAVELLIGARGTLHQQEETYYVPPIKENPQKEDMILPKSASNTNDLDNYLIGERCLDKEIVNELKQEGAIYQALTQKGNYQFSNCAFVGYDKQNKPKYCSLRSMANNFRQDISNSDKSYPFVIKGRSNRLFVCESPIDVISHATLTKLNQGDYKEDTRISTGGLMDKALERYLEENPHITTIVFAFDNDIDGKNFKGEHHNHGQIFGEKCANKFQAKGYRVMIQKPQQKDFNSDLQSIIRAVRANTRQIEMKKRPMSERRRNVGDKMTVGEKIKFLRITKKLSQLELAKDIGYGDTLTSANTIRSRIGQLEIGYRKAKDENLIKIANALGVKQKILMGGSDLEKAVQGVIWLSKAERNKMLDIIQEIDDMEEKVDKGEISKDDLILWKILWEEPTKTMWEEITENEGET